MLNHYIVTALVRFHTPVKTNPVDKNEVPQILVGYYINLGISADSKGQAEQIINDEIKDGVIDVGEYTWKNFDPANCHPDLLDSFKFRPAYPAIWYRSGKILFPDD